MDEDERRLAFARDRIVNRDTVRRINNSRLRLGLNRRNRERK